VRHIVAADIDRGKTGSDRQHAEPATASRRPSDGDRSCGWAACRRTDARHCHTRMMPGKTGPLVYETPREPETSPVRSFIGRPASRKDPWALGARYPHELAVRSANIRFRLVKDRDRLRSQSALFVHSRDPLTILRALCSAAHCGDWLRFANLMSSTIIPLWPRRGLPALVRWHSPPLRLQWRGHR
jgi:hypothetical protein